MLFNSIEFALFLPIVFALYWFVLPKNNTARNILLISAGYVFYGWWDWRFLLLLIFTSFVDFFVGQAIHKAQSSFKKKLFLATSLTINLGLLCFFKYFNFFIDSFHMAFSSIGIDMHLPVLKVLLPVGISFYTFQSLSYALDIYKEKMKPSGNIFQFFAFISFFPQLVAGPIERARTLLPQFADLHIFDYAKASDGMRRILWGLFKKVVVADTCAGYADQIFNSSQNLHGSILFLGAVLFAFQIYGDFSGYSDIALGLASLFGFTLMKNFNYPYFSRNIAEFWQRWHISLSSWFRDYLYIPLGGSRHGLFKHIRNVIIVFTVSGFWHGANWTYVFWGLINGLLFVPLVLANKNAPKGVIAENRILPGLKELTGMIVTFILVCFAWIFFRAENMSQVLLIFKNMATGITLNPISEARMIGLGAKPIASAFVLIFILYFIEWVHRKKDFALDIVHWKPILRWGTYITMIIVVLVYFNLNTGRSFIYFQF